MDRKVSCKKCGGSFRLDSQDDDIQKVTGQDISVGPEEVEKISQDDSYLVTGKLAVKYKFVSEKQIQEALALHEQEKRAGKKLFLGEILVIHGMISQSQLDFLLSVQKMLQTRQLDRSFGMIAVKNDFATQEDIDHAMEEQKRVFKETKSLKLIGDMLVESGVLTEEQRDTILFRQKRIVEGTPEEDKGTDIEGTQDIKGSKIEAYLDLSVSEDQLKAFISPKREVPDEISAKDIKNLLKAKGVKYGIIDDDLIEKYLREKTGEKGPCKIAEGKPPEPGKGAGVKYYFDTDPLKVGAIKEGGDIDFKDRGEIPQVKKGDLLAEKTPAEEGTPGVDVYDLPIPVPRPKDVNLKRGKGASISEDGQRIFSEVDGTPEISVDGIPSVSPVLKISGDIGLKTGHVDFDGDIQVSGGIQEGFRVKGDSLSTEEIFRAEVDMKGEILVLGGIIGAKIKTQGDIRATYIHESQIEAFGDVVVDKEIIDSRIETSGACITERGTILFTSIAAKNGIYAAQIGSETSKPCALLVGVDVSIRNQIERMKETILSKKEEQEKLKTHVEELENEYGEINIEISEMAQMQDSAMVNQRNLQEKIKESKRANNQAQLAKAEEIIKKLDSEIKKREGSLENLFKKQDQIKEKVSDFQQKIKDSETEIQGLNDEIARITEWSKNDKGLPEVKVHGKIFQDATIKGIYSSLTLPESHENILIKERKTIGSDETFDWKMKISRLK